MSTEDGNRLSRWSRLKRKRADGEVVNEPKVTVKDGQGGAVPVMRDAPSGAVPAVQEDDPDADERELTEEEQAYVETLPPVEELNKDSDFTGFMDKRVPEFLRRRALRKLWLSDPAFSFLDGMNEYDEDYSMMVELAAGATTYRPDQGGYAWKEKPKPEAEEGEAGENEAVGEDVSEGGKTTVAEPDDAGAEDTESLAAKAGRVQDRGGSSVRERTYTANPYYQAPGMRNPVSDEAISGAAASVDEDDDLGDAEDDFG